MQPRGAEDCDLPKCRKPNGIPYSSGKIISELSSIIQKKLNVAIFWKKYIKALISVLCCLSLFSVISLGSH